MLLNICDLYLELETNNPSIYFWLFYFCMLVLHLQKISCSLLSLQHKKVIIWYKIYWSLLAFFFLTEPWFIRKIRIFIHQYRCYVLLCASRAHTWSPVDVSICFLSVVCSCMGIWFLLHGICIQQFYPLVFIFTYILYYYSIRNFIYEPPCENARILAHTYFR